MLIELNDAHLLLILKTLAEKHVILHMQKKNYVEIEKLIEFIINFMEVQGKGHLVSKVYKEFKPDEK